MAAVSMAGCGKSSPEGGSGVESGAEEGGGSVEAQVPEAPKGVLLQEGDLEINGSVRTIGKNAFGNDEIPTVTLGEQINPELDAVGGLDVAVNYLTNNRKAGTYTMRATEAVILENMKADLSKYRTDDGFAFIQTDYGIMIVRYNGTSAAALRIPESINNLPVRVISKEAFKKRGIDRVLIPDSVTYIGREAFNYGYSGGGLTSVTIPDGVNIDRGAFANNPLTSITIGNGSYWSDSFAISYRDRYDFDSSFFDFRQKREPGDRAGTYTRPSGDSRNWTYQP
jgi:hypothetical protein